MSVSQILATKDCGLVLKDLKPYWGYLEFHYVSSSFFWFVSKPPFSVWIRRVVVMTCFAFCGLINASSHLP